MNVPDSVLRQLMAVIEDRKANPTENSYTVSLLQGGPQRIGRKIVEEAAEVVEASRESGEVGRTHLIHEAADLIYHLWVVLAYCDVTLEDVEAELARRFGTSGLAEKASRLPAPKAR